MADHSRRLAATVKAATAVLPAGSATVRVQTPLPPVSVDRRELEQVLAAMVRSAWRRTLPGARVLVQARAVGPDRLQIRVADRGPSVALEARPWLLANLRGADGGALSHRLTLEDNPGGGLVHVLTLPVAPGQFSAAVPQRSRSRR
ncbi:hypothetical protein PUR71_05900 [Streptomyces sp. SP17BM10]|uniref:hypothetical protein n=1 Tax=Streptomyces sp. SP17BM10 TaxID=3002530 RepID=UPI002E7851C7|nr:hypothetical protein [Streptomyces sp. SP17BM10]MEE1782455.1 hypothetical protein [Streptomyces sp. SP17BM10]